MRIITKTNHPTNSSAGSSIIKSCTELRDDMISSWICPYISRHLLSLNPLLACCRR
ncbi:hypothetical protein GOB89_04390, partial [Escherichia coli]|nr:hypothetical protein [Escherichia coli]